MRKIISFLGKISGVALCVRGIRDAISIIREFVNNEQTD